MRDEVYHQVLQQRATYVQWICDRLEGEKPLFYDMEMRIGHVLARLANTDFITLTSEEENIARSYSDVKWIRNPRTKIRKHTKR